MNWGGPEEILEWLLWEMKAASVKHKLDLSGTVEDLRRRVDFEDQYEEMRAIEFVEQLESTGHDLDALIAEARQRLKESKVVAA